MGGIEYFSERLNDLIAESGMNIADVAHATGIKLSRLYDFRRGEHAPSLANAIKLKELFKCSLDYMFGFTDDYGSCGETDCTLISDRVRGAIDSYGESRYALSRRTGIDQSQLSKWYNGAKPSLVSLIALAKHLGVSLDYLAGEI